MAYKFIFIALLAVWLDLLAVGWWPIWLYPIWLWVGIFLAVQNKNTSARWLWILSVAAWSLFVTAPFYVIVQAIIYALGGEIYSYFYHRYLPAKSIILPALIGAMVLLVCQTLTLLITQQGVVWYVLVRVVVTIGVTIYIGIYYEAFSRKKKRKYL